jgi:hypothetical protein
MDPLTGAPGAMNKYFEFTEAATNGDKLVASIVNTNNFFNFIIFTLQFTYELIM